MRKAMEGEPKSQTKLPPISVLFTDAWILFKERFLSILFLTLINIGIAILFVISLAVVFLILGFGTIFTSPNKDISALFANPAILIGAVVISVIAVVLMILISLVFQIAQFRIFLENDPKPKLIELIKSSYPLLGKYFFVSLLAGLLILGGYGLFIIPGILIGILLTFSFYELLVNNQQGANALRRSFALVSTNFWPIVGRIALLILISILLSFLAPKESGAAMLMGIINTVFSWYSLAYSITLYKQVANGNKQLPGKSLRPLVIIASIGGIIGTALMVMISGYAYSNLPNLLNREMSPQFNYESRMDGKTPEMPTEQELNNMIKEMENQQQPESIDEEI